MTRERKIIIICICVIAVLLLGITILIFIVSDSQGRLAVLNAEVTAGIKRAAGLGLAAGKRADRLSEKLRNTYRRADQLEKELSGLIEENQAISDKSAGLEKRLSAIINRLSDGTERITAAIFGNTGITDGISRTLGIVHEIEERIKTTED